MAFLKRETSFVNQVVQTKSDGKSFFGVSCTFLDLLRVLSFCIFLGGGGGDLISAQNLIPLYFFMHDVANNT